MGQGRKKNGEQDVGRSRGGNTREVPVVGDGAGNVLGWQVTAGQADDAPQAAGLLAPAQEVVADAAYDSNKLRAVIAQTGAIAVIKPQPRRKHPPHFDPAAYAKRYYLAQAINKLKQVRRIATRYDKLDRPFNSGICLRVITHYLN